MPETALTVPPDAESPLSSADVRVRARAGVLLLTVRTATVRVIGLAGNIALARLLTPDDFGAVAVGLTVVNFGAIAADAGVGASLIGRASAPTTDELGAVLGFQLAVTSALAVVVIVATLPLGHTAHLSALMVVAVPLLMIRVPGGLLSERRLDYRPLFRVEVSDALTYTAWSVGGAALGWGGWALASATVIRALSGSALMLAMVPKGRVRPRLSLGPLRPIWRMGAAFQVGAVVFLVRDLVTNIGVIAIAGTSILGIAALAGRLLQIPLAAFSSISQLAYPTMSRLADAGEDAARVTERAVAALSTVSGAAFVALTVASPKLVPAVFGARWASVSGYLLGACIGLVLSGPASAIIAGYLTSMGRIGIVLRVQVVGAILWWVLSFALVSVLGALGLGLAWAVTANVEIIMLSLLTQRAAGFLPIRRCGAPVAAFAVAVCGGLTLNGAIGGGALAGMATAGAAVLFYVAGLALLDRGLLTDAIGLARGRPAGPRTGA